MEVRLEKVMLAGLLACAVAGWPGTASTQQPQQPKPQQQAAPTQPQPQPPKLNPKEEADYKAFTELKLDNVQDVISKGERFLKDYPESRYRASVYDRLAAAYQTTGNEQKMFADAEKAVELNPDDVSALSLLAGLLPRRINPNEPGAEMQMAKVEQYAKHAMQLLSSISKPATLTDEQFAASKNEALASCHSGLGLVSFYRHNVPQAITELEQATQLGQDPVDFYLLGVAYEQVSRYADAVYAYGKCSAIASAIQDRCKAHLDEAKKKGGGNKKP